MNRVWMLMKLGRIGLLHYKTSKNSWVKMWDFKTSARFINDYAWPYLNSDFIYIYIYIYSIANK